MKTFVLSTAVLTALIQRVAAHGLVNGVRIDGTWYPGFDENPKPGNTPVLVTDYNLPLYNVWDSYVCFTYHGVSSTVLNLFSFLVKLHVARTLRLQRPSPMLVQAPLWNGRHVMGSFH